MALLCRARSTWSAEATRTGVPEFQLFQGIALGPAGFEFTFKPLRAK